MKKIIYSENPCNHYSYKDVLRIIQIEKIGIIFQKNYLRSEK